MDLADSDYISLIHNYCDRWCERCEFTSRCRVFAMDSERVPLEFSDDPIGEAVSSLQQTFAEAKTMLLEHAEEMGIDLEAAMNGPEVDASIQRQHDAIDSSEAYKLAYAYAVEARKLFQARDEWLPDGDDPVIGEMLEIVDWYSVHIGAKVHSGIHATLDMDGYEDAAEIINSQSDANGQIKVALLGLERSIRGWNYLLNDDNAETISPEIERLERVKSLLEEKFPNAHEFMRPGFDEIEMVM